MEAELKEYQKNLEKKEREWERLCLRCGACCGAYDDPCQHLKQDENSKYYCEIYPQRFGIRKTVGGDIFKCVAIKKLLSTHWRGSQRCPYKNTQKLPLKA